MQLDLFDVLYDDFKFDTSKPVRLVETFAGIGTQKMGFERAGIDVDVIAIVEVDKHALLSYAAIHTNYLGLRNEYFKNNEVSTSEMVRTLQNKNIGFDFKNDRHTITERNNVETIRDYYLADLLTNNLGDISKVKGSDLPKGIDMLTYSFPCTDLSKAGQQKGLDGTRSGLVYEVFRIVEELKQLNNKPKTLLMENVIDLIQKKFINEFHEMQFEVETFGYQNYTFVMNAKDYGVAQNRNRVFMLSVPSEMNYVEPKPFKLKKRLKDYLEHEVDEKYYLSDKQIDFMNKTNFRSMGIESVNQENGICQTLTTMQGGNREPKIAYALNSREFQQRGWLDECPTLCARDYKDPKVLLIPEDTKKGYDKAYEGDGVYINRPHQKRGVVQKGMIQTLKTSGNDVGVVVEGENANGVVVESKNYSEYSMKKIIDNICDLDGNSKTITANPQRPTIDSATLVKRNLRIRKLTPNECWRLMGIDDEYFNKAKQVSSNAQLYKQAGNAIVVDVFANIVKNLI